MRLVSNPQRRARRRRAGALIMIELLFAVPILAMILLGVVEFYMVVNVRMQMLNATRLGARTAVSHTYADRAAGNAEVAQTIHRALGNGRLSRAAHVHVTWAQDVKPEEQIYGDADWVQVKVDVRARSVVPDVLGWVGFTLGNRVLVADTMMKQE